MDVIQYRTDAHECKQKDAKGIGGKRDPRKDCVKENKSHPFSQESEQIKSLYDVDIAPELVSKISEKIMPEVTAWQNRPLESVYPFVFLDAIHYKVKENHQYQTKAAYVVLGVTMDGTKDILGVWIGEHESSKF